jgi:hypothetical protein
VGLDWAETESLGLKNEMAAICVAREHGAPVRLCARLSYYGGKSRVWEAKRERMYSRHIRRECV